MSVSDGEEVVQARCAYANGGDLMVQAAISRVFVCDLITVVDMVVVPELFS